MYYDFDGTCMGIFTKSDKSELTELVPIVRASEPAKLDLIFVHGLDGDAKETWRFQDPESWHTWISSALPNVNIWSLRYRLRASRWFGGSMPLTDRAVNVLATLDSELQDKRSIVFVCHSYGGLLVKQLLRSGRDIAKEYVPLVERVAGIIFLATPHNGSMIPHYIGALKKIIRSSDAIAELNLNGPLFRELSKWFRNHAEDTGWRLLVFFETLETYGVLVVDESSADPAIKNVAPVPIDANHTDICKPPIPDARVKQTIKLLKEALAGLAASAPSGQSPLARIRRMTH